MQKTGRAVKETQTPCAAHAPENCTGDFLISAGRSISHAVSPIRLAESSDATSSSGTQTLIRTHRQISSRRLLDECDRTRRIQVVQPRGW